MVQTEKSGKVTPVKITSARLSYTDSERKARFEGGVQAKGRTSRSRFGVMDVFLQPSSKPLRIKRLRDRKARPYCRRGAGRHHSTGPQSAGEQLVYTTAEDKFVLTGGSPSIFDAEHGKITGVSLTFFRRDGRVLVEGNNTSPTVTQTRVAR